LQEKVDLQRLKMSKKKGKKMGLQEFLGKDFQVPDDNLPRAPSCMPREDRRNRHSGGGGFGEGRAGSGGFGDDVGGGEFDEPAFSPADEDTQWRRGPPPPRGGMGASSDGGGFDRPVRGGGGGGGGEEEEMWRRPTGGPPISRGDMDDQWRRGPPQNETPDSGFRAPPAADEASDWRRDKVQLPPRPGPPMASEADSTESWRRGVPVSAPAPPRSAPQSGSDWRKATPVSSTVGDDGRPKLSLNPRTSATSSENGSTGVSDGAASDQGSRASEKSAEGGGDKWDRLFKKSARDESSHLRFGDRTEDQEKEREFSAFSSQHNPFQKNRMSAGPGSERGFGTGFSSASGFPAERPGSHAFGGRRRAEFRNEGSNAFGMGRRGAEFGNREEMPGSAAFGVGNKQMERREFPGGGMRRQNDFDYEQAASAFSGSRRRPEGADFEESPTFQRPQQPRMPDVEDRRPPATTKGKSLSELAKAVESVGDWGDAVEGKNDSTASKQQDDQPKALSQEELEARAEALLRTYYLDENRTTAVEAVKELRTTDFSSEIIRRASLWGLEEGVKECKIVVSLVKALQEADLATQSDSAKAVDAICEKMKELEEKDEEKLKNLRNLASILVEKEAMNADDLSDEACEIALPDTRRKSTQTATATEEKVAELLASDLRGKALADTVDVKTVEKVIGALFLAKFLELNTDVLKDENLSWLKKDQFGSLLSKTLFEEYPDREKLKVQVRALYAVQQGFHKLGFPRASNNQAMIERVFMKMYNDDIVPEEAIFEWKDDLTDTDGKMDALVQLTQFVTWLAEEEEEGEEDDEDEE